MQMKIGSLILAAAAITSFCWPGVVRAQEEHGTTVVGAPGITETVEEIMARAARDDKPWDPADGIKLIREFHNDRTGLAQNPDAPATAMWPINPGVSPISSPFDKIPGGKGGGGLYLPQTVGTGFNGVTFGQTPGYVPPDSTGAVGPTQVLVCANGRIRVYSKTGVLGGLNATTDTFFTSVRAGQTTSDPQVKFDRISNRWFVTIITTSTPNRILIAVSSGPTISNTSSFTFFGFSQDADGKQVGAFADHEKTGVDANAVVMGCNMFTGASGGSIWVVNKAQLLAGSLIFTSFRNQGIETPNGVDNDDATATESYVMGTSTSSFSQIVFKRIANPGGTPTIASTQNLTVPVTALPQSQPAAGTTGGLDPIDDRIAYAQAHKDRFSGQTRIVAAHNIKVTNAGVGSSSGSRNAIRWYQIGNVTGTVNLVQSGTLFDPNATVIGYWMGSAAMTGQGHLAIASTGASSASQTFIPVSGRLRTDTLGTTQAPTTAQGPVANYNIQGSGTQRWGDYAMTSVDPTDDQTVWAFAEYCDAANSWAVRAIQLKAPPPATPSSCSPPSVAQGASNVNVVVTGTSVSGSEFFDPDASFPNHIAASFSGSGITVNSVSWSPATPLSATVNISVSGGAATGLRNVTITNPDGQSATGNNLLTINSASVCPSFTLNPSGGTFCEGANVVLSVAATGTPAPTLQWRKNTVDILGQTGTTLTLNPVQASDAGSYDCVATNACGPAVSNAAVIAVNTVAQVTSNPSDVAVRAVYFSATFSVGATGTPSPTYQWRRNGVDLVDGGAVSGATTPTLTFNPADRADDGTTIDCVVTNVCGSATSTAALYTVYCPSDFDQNGFVNGDDFDAYVVAFEAGDPSADFDNNLFVNGDDFDAYVVAFEAGC